MLNPAAHLTAFDVSCLWLGIDGQRIHAVTGEAALMAVLTAHGVDMSTLWGVEHEPADYQAAGGDGLCETWSATFTGQTWENGDWNPETITVYTVELEPEDCVVPC